MIAATAASGARRSGLGWRLLPPVLHHCGAGCCTERGKVDRTAATAAAAAARAACSGTSAAASRASTIAVPMQRVPCERHGH